jgi:hypothetical protein
VDGSSRTVYVPAAMKVVASQVPGNSIRA